MNYSNCVLLLVSASILCGCGGGVSDAPELAQVSGKVSWKGAPLVEASVAFMPENGPVATGRTDESGQFTLKTHGQNGASLGTHRVTIQAYEPPPAGKPAVDENGEPTYTPVSKIPQKYANPDESGLEASVTKDASRNSFNFNLD